MRHLQWVLDNLWTLIIIAGVLAQLLQSARARKEGRDATGAPEAEEMDADDLSRRIREDIQRRIAERQRGGDGGPPVVEPPPVFEEELPPYREVMAPPPPVRPAPAAARWDTQRTAEILEQQASLAERLKQVETMRASAARRAAFEEKTAPVATRQRQAARGALLGDLRDPGALRRAFVLREVLGPPVGLR